MLQEPKLKTLFELIESFSSEELIWTNGYITGLLNKREQKLAGNAHSNASGKPVSSKKINLLYGTETGNAKRLATQLAAVGKKNGVAVKLTGVDQYRLTDLEKEEYLFIVISTQGEGDPPATAKKFYEHIHQQQLSLGRLKFSVLGLGDSSYPFFCKTGEDVDKQLSAFGAERVIPLQRCDVDYEEEAQGWFSKVLNYVKNEEVSFIQEAKPATRKGGGRKYYQGTILTNINLNDRGSAKETYHIEIATEETIVYEPGDAIGIVPSNRKEVIEKIALITGVDLTTTVETKKVTASLEELLTEHLNICYLPLSIVNEYGKIINQDIPAVRIDLVDLLRIYPIKTTDQFIEVVKALTPIAPRLYSIASSPAAHGDTEVHITVSKNSFNAEDEQRFGLCSEFLGYKPVQSSLTFYVHKNKGFKLPDEEKDIIMIGPGTGIAPFRSFLAERNAKGDAGQNWLFFGEQHFVTDFLYQTEIQEYVQTGVLSRIDLAFSRDQKEKIYVQHRMEEKGSELYAWLENGAVLYVCGAKEPMSADVETILKRIIQQHGNKTEEEAKGYIESLIDTDRYHKDVY